MLNLGEQRKARCFDWARTELLADNYQPYRCVKRMVRLPVTIEEFVQSKEFVGVLDDFHVWPYWKRELKRINPDVLCGDPPIFRLWLATLWRVAYHVDEPEKQVRILRIFRPELFDYDTLLGSEAREGTGEFQIGARGDEPRSD